MAKVRWTPTGEMRQVVTLHAPADVVTKGSVVASFNATPAMTSWARIEPMRGENLMIHDAPAGRLFFKVNIGYVAGITSGHQVRWSDGGTTRFFRIAGPPKDIMGIHRELELVCTEET